jgi:hypothetical protein
MSQTARALARAPAPAQDLGGTNVRVMYAKLGSGTSELSAQLVEEFSLPPHIYTGPGEALFDFLAAKLKSFIDRQGAGAAAKPGEVGVDPLGARASLRGERCPTLHRAVMRSRLVAGALCALVPCVPWCLRCRCEPSCALGACRKPPPPPSTCSVVATHISPDAHRLPCATCKRSLPGSPSSPHKGCFQPR